MITVKSISIEDIKISGRARQDIGDLSSIKFSIQKVGLLMPVLLNEHLELLDGERRIRACQELELTEIPARIISGITPDNKLLIERIANTDRKDFVWAEELELKLRIHEYHTETAKKWTYRDTCEFLGVSLGGLSTDLQLATALRTFPELSKAKTKRQAYDTYKKLIQRADAIQALDALPEEERARLEQMLQGKNPQAEISDIRLAKVTSHYEEGDIIQIEEFEDDLEERDLFNSESSDDSAIKFIYQICSWEELLSKLPPKVIGFAELDPPYAIDYNSIYVSDTNQNNADWTLEQLTDNMSRMLPELYEKLLDDSWVLCWSGYEHVECLNKMALGAGFSVQRPGFWFKPGGTANSLMCNLISNYETYLLFRKGQASFNTKNLMAGFEASSLPASKKYHQWHKPLDVYQRFFDSLGRHGSIFFSPFAGSGSSMICAALNSMVPVGCDTSSKYFYQFYQTLKEHINVEQTDLSDLPLD